MSKNKLFIKIAGFFTLVTLISSVVISFTARAGFTEMPTTLPDITTSSYLRLSTLGDDSSTGANDYAKYLKILVYKDSSNVPGAALLHFNSGDSCNDKDIVYSSAVADDSGNQTSAIPPWMGNSLSESQTTLYDVCGGNIRIPDAAFGPSSKFGGSIEVAVLQLELSNGVFTFNIGRASSSDRIRLSTIGVNSNSSDTSPTNLPRSYGTLLKVRGGGSKMVAKFGVPCDFDTPSRPDIAGGYRRIYWKGADSNTSINPGTIDIEISGGLTSLTISDAENGPNVKYTPPIKLTKGDKFTVTFDGIDNSNNAILLWLPFDSAGYDTDCNPNPIPNGWNVSWVSNFVRRTDGLNFGYTAGSLNNPGDLNAPQPGQSFQFINDARNGGGREITNLRWTKVCTRTTNVGTGQCHSNPNRWLSNSYLVRNTGYNPYADPIQNQANFSANTQTIHFSNGANLGTNVGAGGYVGGPGWAWDTFNVSAADGGRTYCGNASFWPSKGTGNTTPGVGTTSWTVDNTTVHAPQLCVLVPYYYNLTPNVSVTGMQGGTVQQGTSPSVTASISQPGATNGRNNTYSEPGKQKGLLQLLLAPGEVEPANKTAEALSTSSPAVWCAARTAGSADCSTPYTTTSAVGVPGSPLSANLTGTLNPNTDTLPVGTKLCYSTYVQHPRNTESGDVGGAGDGRFSYSDIKCAIVVKSPKVQFLNSDVTVGRQSSAMAECSENQVADAPIITVGSPANRSPSNLYGSWVEYGAFATGKITNFGSAAVPFGTVNEPRKLTFGNNGFNTTGNLGEFVYGKNCIADFFSMVKEDNTNLASLGGAVFNQGTGVLDLQQLGAGTDKTGYVATDRNILIGEPTTTSSAPDTTPTPTTQSTVKVNARATGDVGNNGCPKLMIKVTDSGGNVDQDTKTICATGFQDYEYIFYQNTGGPKRVEARFVNDGIVANVDRNIALRSIDVNGQDTYVSSRSSNPGSSIIGGGTSCMNSGVFYLYRSVSEGDPALNCFGVVINPVNAPLPPAQQQADYAPPEETTIIITARATLSSSPDGTSSVPGGCPYMYVRVTGTNGSIREHTQAVCSTSQSPYSFTVNLGGGGVSSVEASFDPMDYYNGGSDRNLYVSNVRVGTTSIPINANSGANVQLRNGTGGYGAVSAAPATCKDNDTVIFLSAINNVTTGWCASVRVTNVTPPPPPAPSPAPSLTSDYDGFKGRSIVIYARKTSTGACSSSSNGNITINKDLIYKKDGFGSVLDIPRITIMADCNITIADNVVDVNANLIAGDAIKTCTDKAQTQDKCNNKLVVRGAISANRLLLWRTYGADNSPSAPDPQYPAETFDLSPSQIISGYNRGIRSAKPSTVYEVDLPPRY